MNTLTLPNLDIVRTWHNPVRAVDPVSDALAVLEIRYSRFDTWYEINSWWEGHFLERTQFGAFAKTIAETGMRTKVLFNHGGDFSIGDKILGGVDSHTEERESPLLVSSLFDTSYNRDLLPGLRAGVYGSSFMFRVIQESWNDDPGVSDHNPLGLPERTITEVRLFEAGPVTWPANPDATAGLRSCVSGTDAYYEHLRSRDPNGIDELRSRVTAFRTSNRAAAGHLATVDGGEAAPVLPIEPAARHSGGGMTPAQRREVLYPFLRNHNGSGDSAGASR